MPARLDFITAEDLSAYLDGQCDPDLLEAVAGITEQDERCVELVSAYLTQSKFLAQSLHPILEEPVPERLIELLRAHKAKTDPD